MISRQHNGVPLEAAYAINWLWQSAIYSLTVERYTTRSIQATFKFYINLEKYTSSFN